MFDRIVRPSRAPELVSEATSVEETAPLKASERVETAPEVQRGPCGVLVGGCCAVVLLGEHHVTSDTDCTCNLLHHRIQIPHPCGVENCEEHE